MGVLSVIRDLDEVAAEAGSGSVAVISCNNCVRGCGSGGDLRLPAICEELEKRGVRVEERILTTNLCARAWMEHYPLAPAVKTAVVFACSGAQEGLKSLLDDVRIVPGVETLGLMVAAKARGRLKLVATFPGYEHLLGREYKAGDTTVSYDDELLSMAPCQELECQEADR